MRRGGGSLGAPHPPPPLVLSCKVELCMSGQQINSVNENSGRLTLVDNAVHQELLKDERGVNGNCGVW